MFVIVIGPDNAGKSTIIRGIQQTPLKFDTYFKGLAPENPHAAAEAFWKVVKVHLQTGNSYLCDRLYYPDDIIYREVVEPGFKDISTAVYDQEAGMMAMLKEIDAFFVLVTASPDTLVARGVDNRRYVDAEQLREVKRRYDDLFMSYPLPFTVIDTDVYNKDQAVDKVWRDIIYFYEIGRHIGWKGNQWGSALH